VDLRSSWISAATDETSGSRHFWVRGFPPIPQKARNGWGTELIQEGAVKDYLLAYSLVWAVRELVTEKLPSVEAVTLIHAPSAAEPLGLAMS
jgi:hypothetical protein